MATPESALSLFARGDKVFIPGSSAEPRPLIQAISENRDALPAMTITNSFVPGVNPLQMAAANNAVTETVIFPRGGDLIADNRVRQMPLSYYGFQQYLATQDFDWVVAHVSPPDDDGQCSLGVSVEFMPTVLRRTKRILGIINGRMPRLSRSPTLKLSEFEQTIEIDSDLVTYDVGKVDETSAQIAEQVKSLLDDGSVIQVGLGKMPDKLVSSLTEFKDLRFHSGMLSDGFVALANTDALDPDFVHVTCSALGTTDFYAELDQIETLQVCGVDDSHAPANLVGYEKFVAINSALEVDLLGQANLETAAGRPVSGVGGSADFARAARWSTTGKSIIALPSTAAKGATSRIVPRLAAGPTVSLGRFDVDYVVTEHGAARLKGRSVAERANALIAIADPVFREELELQRRALLS